MKTAFAELRRTVNWVRSGKTEKAFEGCGGVGRSTGREAAKIFTEYTSALIALLAASIIPAEHYFTKTKEGSFSV